MNGMRVIAGVLVLWSSVVGAATLTWNPNSDSVAGYHVYLCTQLPCVKAWGFATLLATLGNVTSFDIGTPAVTQSYVVTAYDFSNNESAQSNVATYIPADAGGAAPPSVSLSVVGSPNLGQPWTVVARTNVSGPILVQFWINGFLANTSLAEPHCAFGGVSWFCTFLQKPSGNYRIEARVLNNGTEVARQAIVVSVP